MKEACEGAINAICGFAGCEVVELNLQLLIILFISSSIMNFCKEITLTVEKSGQDDIKIIFDKQRSVVMKLKEIPDTKTLSTNTNKKKLSEIPEGEKKAVLSLLKKNEFALILSGALLLTLIIFFFFFRTSDPVSQPAPANSAAPSSHDIENRIGKMEQALQVIEKSTSPEGSGTTKEKVGINPLEDRVARLETAFSVKMESMIERIGKIEKHMAQLTAKTDVTPDAPVTKTELAAAAPEKKIVKKEKKESIFHTVQKGETLFSISKKYNINVETLRKLNNLPANAAIFPGNNILVK